MFSSKKKDNVLLRAKINTLIGEGTEVEGVVKFSGGLHVVGKINGGAVSVEDGSVLIISEHAEVRGNIKVKHLIVNGRVDGEVYVDGKVELFDKARINGDIYYKVLELPVGAQVSGKLIRIEEDD